MQLRILYTLYNPVVCNIIFVNSISCIFSYSKQHSNAISTVNLIWCAIREGEEHTFWSSLSPEYLFYFNLKKNSKTTKILIVWRKKPGIDKTRISRPRTRLASESHLKLDRDIRPKNLGSWWKKSLNLDLESRVKI